MKAGRGPNSSFVLVGAVAIALAMLFAGPAAARVPAGFFGIVPQAPVRDADFDRMQGTIETMRVPFEWNRIEPRPGSWDFAATDSLLERATARGIRILPVLGGTPSWLAADPATPPTGAAQRAGWKRFLRALVRRYGTRGKFWKGRARRLPIRSWQVWNEPNFVLFWRPRPEPAAYVRLLAASAGAIRSQDPKATVIAAGVAPIEGGMLPWEFLRRMYEVPGAKRSFDVAALHPYAASARGVMLEVRETRRVMNLAGDRRTPLRITEIGVASGGRRDAGRARRQARFIRRAVGNLTAHRRTWRIAGVDWFTWQDGPTPVPNCVFCQRAGLLWADGRSKPAWKALRRVKAQQIRSSGFKHSK